MSWVSDFLGIDINLGGGTGNSVIDSNLDKLRGIDIFDNEALAGILKTFEEVVTGVESTVSNVGNEAGGAVKSGGDIIRNTIDTGVKAIEDTADEIGRVDDNILGGFTKQGFEAVTAGFKSKLNEVGSAIFKGNAKKDGSSKDLTGLTADLMFGGNNGKRKKGKVSSGMGLSVAEDTGLQS